MILGVLLMLSAILMTTTVFPHVSVTLLLILLSAVLFAALVGIAVLAGSATRKPVRRER
jgi:hypothetical protein